MFLDIAVGIIGTLLYATVTDENQTLALIVAGIFFSLLPDIDFIIGTLRKKTVGRFAHQHRDLLHFPLLYLPFIFLLILPFGIEFAIFATSLSFVHFLHDSIGVGWGIKWLFPFSSRSFKFFYNGKILKSWTPEQLTRHVQKHGDDHWIKNIYLRPSKTLILELSVLLIALLAALLAIQAA